MGPIGECGEPLERIQVARISEQRLEIASAEPDSGFIANCRAMYSDKTDCSQYTEVIGMPENCLDEVNSTPCSLFDPIKGIPLPLSCKAKNLFY